MKNSPYYWPVIVSVLLFVLAVLVTILIPEDKVGATIGIIILGSIPMCALLLFERATIGPDKQQEHGANDV